MQRSTIKPLLWLLFSVGGTLAALLMPIVIFILGILYPLDLLPNIFAGQAYLAIPWINVVWRLAVFFLLLTVLWHCIHRLFLTAKDLYLVKGHRYSKYAFYGFALLVSLGWTIGVIGLIA